MSDTLRFFFSVAGGSGDPYHIWLVLILVSLGFLATRLIPSLRLSSFILLQLVFAGYMLLAAFWAPNLAKLSQTFAEGGLSLGGVLPVVSWIVVLWNAAFAMYTAYIAGTSAQPFAKTRVLVFGGHVVLFGLLAVSVFLLKIPFALPGLLPVVIYSWCVTSALRTVCDTGQIDGV